MPAQTHTYIHSHANSPTHTYTPMCTHIPEFTQLHRHTYMPTYMYSIQPCHLGEAVMGENTAIYIQLLSREKCFLPQGSFPQKWD